ncbi:hypothetical protein J0910_07115 [Nocardiopsis sp. CNT-189]|uniref:hypothetical protein n=1 Tax=Nocardiopsis oceanisediminis TaxID=2816862 RepID=UPI003B325630
MVLFEALRETANYAAALYKEKAEAATTLEAKEEAKQQMLRTWRIKTKHNLSRSEMTALLQELQAEIDLLQEV